MNKKKAIKIIEIQIEKELVALKWIESKKLQNKNWCYGVFELQQT